MAEKTDGKGKRGSKKAIEETDLLYRTDTKIKGVLRRLENRVDISNHNKKLILEFKDHTMAKGLSKFRTLFYLDRLMLIASIVQKDLEKCERKDMERVMAEVNSRNYSAWYVEDIKSALKVYYRYVYDLDATDPAPKIVRWIHRKRPKNTLKKEDLYTPDEINAVIRAAGNSRDKCAIALSIEGALRPGELRNIRMGRIVEKPYGFKIEVDGKTGKGDIYITIYKDFLTQWINEHPASKSSSYLICPFNDPTRPITHEYLANVFKKAQKVAGLKKTKNNLYLMRHTQLTNYTIQRVPERTIKMLARQSPNSKILSTYQHLSSEDAEREYLRVSGADVELEDAPKNERKECAKCKAKNTPTNILCHKCGSVLNQGRFLKQETESVVSMESMGAFADMLKPMIQKELNRLWLEKLKNEQKQQV